MVAKHCFIKALFQYENHGYYFIEALSLNKNHGCQTLFYQGTII